MILAAGKGERMYPLTKEVPKALLNIGGKTLIDRAIERFLTAGIDKIVVAVGWKGSMVKDHLASSKIKVNVVDVVDYEIGPLQTLMTAIETFEDDFLLTPVDTLIESSTVSGMLESAKHGNLTLAVDLDTNSGTQVSITQDGFISGFGEDVTDTGIIGHSASLFIGNSRLANVCRTALDTGETKFVALLSQMIRNGNLLRSYSVDSHSIDIDTLPDVLTANRQVLQRGGFSQTGQVFVPVGDSIEIGDSFELNSNITLQKGTELKGPVLISQGCDIGEKCQIGPNTTIGPQCSVSTGCEISNTVVFGESSVSNQSRLHGAIVYKSKQYFEE